DCNNYGVDPIDDFVAIMASLSISGLQRPALCAAYNRDRPETTMATLSSLPGTSTDAQMIDVFSEDSIWDLGGINQEEPQPSIPPEVEKTECERTEKPKLRRGGILH
ncbi:hypothetical protein E3U43_020625, partial [Larimichthys crocea]